MFIHQIEKIKLFGVDEMMFAFASIREAVYAIEGKIEFLNAALAGRDTQRIVWDPSKPNDLTFRVTNPSGA